MNDMAADISLASSMGGRRSRDLMLPAMGQSGLLGYLEANTDWVERLEPRDAATRPHALFVHIAMLGEISMPGPDGSPPAIHGVLARHRDQTCGNRDVAVVFDYSHEGPAFDLGMAPSFQALHALLREFDIPASRAVFLHHNERLRESEDGYFTWCRRLELGPMRMAYSQWWLLEQAVLLQRRYGPPAVFQAHQDSLIRALSPDSLHKTHKFLCFNYFPRLHRVLLLLFLLRHDLLKDGLVSFPGFRIPESEFDFMQDTLLHIDQWRLGAALKPMLPRLDHLSPLRVDSDASHNKSTLTTLFADAPFAASVFSVVTETGFSHGVGTRRVTEKFLRPLVQMHPFMVAGEPGSLGLIRELGFETFAPFFDESYDSIIEPEQRLEHLLAAIRRKCDLSIAELAAETRAIMPVLQRNLHHAVHGLWDRVREESEYPVIDLLLDILALPGPRIATRFPAELRSPPPPDDPAGAVIDWEERLLGTMATGAIFDSRATTQRDGRIGVPLRATPTHGNHCVLFRLDVDLRSALAFSVDVKASRAERLLVQIKDPTNERFRGTFSFELGIIIGNHSVDDVTTIESSARYLGDEWFRLRFTGRVGGDGPLDIVFYAGRTDFVYQAPDDIELWIANTKLVRLDTPG